MGKSKASPKKRQIADFMHVFVPPNQHIEDAQSYLLQDGGEEIRKKVEHPPHYTNHPSGIECIQITEHMNFTLGNAVKYIWRADLKNGVEDLMKAKWYVEREIQRRTKK